MIGVVLLAAMHRQGYTVDPAVDAAKRMLAGFGVGRTRLQSLGSHGRYAVGLTDAKGTTYTVILSTGLRCEFIETKPRLAIASPSATNLTGTRYEALARRWLSKVAGKETLRLQTIQGFSGYGRAFFATTRNGYPFVSGGAYGYGFQFSMPAGEFLGYEAHESPPLVSNAKPTLTLTQAVGVLERKYKEMNAASKNGLTYSYRLMDGAALGYYASGSGVAPLVWRIPYIAMQSGRFGSRGGSNAILVDAVTGRQIPTSVVP